MDGRVTVSSSPCAESVVRLQLFQKATAAPISGVSYQESRSNERILKRDKFPMKRIYPRLTGDRTTDERLSESKGGSTFQRSFAGFGH